MAEIKLPKPASCATDEELQAYLAQFSETGDRRVLAVEILRLRQIVDEMVTDFASEGHTGYGKTIRTEKPVKSKATSKQADKDIF